jgi:hypothetical protein
MFLDLVVGKTYSMQRQSEVAKMPVKPDDSKQAFEACTSDWWSETRSGVIVLSVIEDGKERLWNCKQKKVGILFPRVEREVVEARGPFCISVVDPAELAQAFPAPMDEGLAASIGGGRGGNVGGNDYVAMKVKGTKEEIWTDASPTHLGEARSISVVAPDKLEQTLPAPMDEGLAASIGGGRGGNGGANEYVAMRVMKQKEDIWAAGAPTHLCD